MPAIVLDTIDQVLAHYLPAARYLQQLRGITWADGIATPGSLHILRTVSPVDDTLRRALCANRRVVASVQTDHGFSVHLTSDYGLHHQVTRTLHRTGTALDDVQYPTYWHIEFRHGYGPLHLPTAAQRAAISRHVRDVAALASPYQIRQAILQADVGFANRIKNAHGDIDQALRAGTAFAWPCTALPTSLQFTDDLSCFVIQDTVSKVGPWILTRDQNRQSIVTSILATYPRTGSFRPPVLGDRLALPAAPAHQVAQLDITLQGRMSAQLYHRIWTSEQARRFASRQPGSTFTPLPRNVPNPAIVDRYTNVSLLARSTTNSDLSYAANSAVQILTMLVSPPDYIDPTWCNVDKITVCIERESSWLDVHDRRCALAHLELTDGPILAVNPDRVSRVQGEAASLEQRFPGRIWTTGMRRRYFGELALDDNEDEADDDEDGGHQAADLAEWSAALDTRFAHQVDASGTLVKESTFYRQAHTFMERHVALGVRHDALASSLQAYMQNNQLVNAYAFRRVSQGPIGQQSNYNSSLQRQIAFLSSCWDDMLGVNLLIERLDYVSISRNSSAVANLVAQHPNSLFLITSIDRLARTRAGLNEVRQACRDHNVHVVAAIFPSSELANLVHLAPAANTALDQAARTYLLQSYFFNCSPHALPSCWPTVVAGPNLDPAVQAIVDRRVQASALYLDGYNNSTYVGNTSITLPPTIRQGSIHGFNDRMKQELLYEIGTLLPIYNGAIEILTFQNRGAIDCRCPNGQCVLGLSVRTNSHCTACLQPKSDKRLQWCKSCREQLAPKRVCAVEFCPLGAPPGKGKYCRDHEGGKWRDETAWKDMVAEREQATERVCIVDFCTLRVRKGKGRYCRDHEGGRWRDEAAWKEMMAKREERKQ